MSLNPDANSISREFDAFFNSVQGQRYDDKIRDMLKSDKKRLTISIDDVRQFNPELAQNIISHPIDYFPLFEDALKEHINEIDNGFYKNITDSFHIAMEGSFGSQKMNPRQLEASKFGTMVCIEGIVTKTSLVRPKVTRSVHYCPATNQYSTRPYSDQTTLDPYKRNTSTTSTYPTKDDNGNLIITEYGYCQYRNHQSISIQEMPESSPMGQLPRSVDIYVNDDLVDQVKPGDRVQVFGIYKSLGGGSQQGITSGSFKSVILANNLNVIHVNQPPKMDHEDMTNIRKISKRADLFDILSRSIAPSIKGHNYIKRAILLMLLGGAEKTLDNNMHLRGDINVLLVGDPSCGKSQFLRFVLHTAPLAVNTTGRGSSGVGLTAAVVRDPDTGERRVEGGAFVLGDRGIICIDEFDKMNEGDRVAIHEVMEQQSITISKGGVYCSLNARCSVLAAANPIYGQYDTTRTPQENIGLPDSLLSRFDLLFIVRDEMDSEKDREIAEHVLKMHQFTDSITRDYDQDNERENENNHEVFTKDSKGKNKKGFEVLSLDFLKKYIMFAKTITPELTDDSERYISDAYVQLRQRDDNRTLPITVRVLESLIRIATAHAKSRLSKTIDIIDCENALDIVSYSLYHDAQVSKKSQKRRQGEEEEEEAELNLSDSDKEEEEEEEEPKEHQAKRTKRVVLDDDDEEEEEEMPSDNEDSHGENKQNEEDEQYLDIDRESEEYVYLKSAIAQLYHTRRVESLTTNDILESLVESNPSLTRAKLLAYLDEMDNENVIMGDKEGSDPHNISWYKV
ncbi:hypothetical protein WA158_002939 [Blastocystis sp. Blastoise]